MKIVRRISMHNPNFLLVFNPCIKVSIVVPLDLHVMFGKKFLGCTSCKFPATWSVCSFTVFDHPNGSIILGVNCADASPGWVVPLWSIRDKDLRFFNFFFWHLCGRISMDRPHKEHNHTGLDPERFMGNLGSILAPKILSFVTVCKNLVVSLHLNLNNLPSIIQRLARHRVQVTVHKFDTFDFNDLLWRGCLRISWLRISHSLTKCHYYIWIVKN